MEIIINKANVRLFDEINMNTNTTSEIFEVKGTSLFCIQHKWTSKTGTVTVLLQGSNFPSSTSDSDYFDIDSYVIPNGSDTRGINYEKAGFAFIRLKLTQTSGTGTITTIVNAKVL